MSLYACAQCNTVENTAMTNYHIRKLKNQPLLCSVCDPLIRKWHGQFPQRLLADTQYQFCPDQKPEHRILCPQPDGYDYCKHGKGGER